MTLHRCLLKDLQHTTGGLMFVRQGVGDVLIGAAATIAEYNGVEEASHIKDKIVEMNKLQISF